MSELAIPVIGGSRDGERVRITGETVRVVRRRNRYARQIEACLGEPLLKIGHDRGIVKVQMRARREKLDRLEAVRRNLNQMLPREPLCVKQSRRDTKAAILHETNHLS